MLIHQEGEVLVVVVRVVGQDVEDHAAEHLFTFGFRQPHLAAHPQQPLVAVGFRVERRQGLHVQLLVVFAVKTSGDKMVLALNVH